MILRLGSGEASFRGCESKAAILDRAARAGLDVPEGVVVTDEALTAWLERGLARVEGRGGRMAVAVPDPLALLRFLKLESATGRLAVRSAFSAEDGAGESLAGWFASGLFVDGRAPAAVAAALAGVWASAFRRPGRFRRDVIVQAMVTARRAGVAFTEGEHEDDLVNAAPGTADLLLSGQVAGEAFAGLFRAGDASLPPFLIPIDRLSEHGIAIPSARRECHWRWRLDTLSTHPGRHRRV